MPVVHFDVGQPALALGPPADASSPAFVAAVTALVSLIDDLGNVSKIADAIIVSIPVDVVDRPGPADMHHCPDHAMREDNLIEDLDGAIAIAVDEPGLFAGVELIPARRPFASARLRCGCR